MRNSLRDFAETLFDGGPIHIVEKRFDIILFIRRNIVDHVGVLPHVERKNDGKTRELAWKNSFSYTIEGQMIGHISIAQGMLREKVQTLAPFPEKLRVLVEHMILSHHGRYEFGSPKLPMTPEAVVEEELVPENLLSAIVRQDQFEKGFLQGPLSAEGMGIWETAWSEIKAT